MSKKTVTTSVDVQVNVAVDDTSNEQQNFAPPRPERKFENHEPTHKSGIAKRVLIGAGIVAVLFVATIAVLGAIAPTDLHVEREVLIYKPKEVVFEDLKYMKSHDRWSPWFKRDPNMVKEYQGEDGTVGFVSSWSGNDEVGVGEQEIIKIAEGERIDYELRFKKPMEDTSAAYLITEALDTDQTKVKWGMQGKTPFPGNVICMVMNMKQTLAKDFDEGLAMLKADLEKRP